MMRRLMERIFTVSDGTSTITFDATNATAIGLDYKNLGYLFRRSHEYKYCEAKYGSVFIGHVSMAESDHWREEPGAPFIEVGAVASAGFILWCGCHMLLFWRHDSTLLHLIASLFVVNGIGAGFAHAWSQSSWHRIDGMSMALTAWIACGFLFEEVSENYFADRRREGRRAVWRLLAWFVFLFIFWWFSETNAAVSHNLELGDYVDFLIIALPMALCVIMAVIVIWQGWAVNAYVDAKVARKAKHLFCRGLIVAFLGIATWVVTEKGCDTIKALRYVPGHLVWHVTMAYGLTMMLLLGGVLRADNFKKKPRIWRPRRKGKGFCRNGAYNCLTSLYFDAMPEFAHVDPALDASTGFESVALHAVQRVNTRAMPSPFGKKSSLGGLGSLKNLSSMGSFKTSLAGRFVERLRPSGTRIAPPVVASSTPQQSAPADLVVAIDPNDGETFDGVDTVKSTSPRNGSSPVGAKASAIEPPDQERGALLSEDLNDQEIEEFNDVESGASPKPRKVVAQPRGET